MPTRTIGERRRGPAERDWADVRAGRPIPVHHVVARYSDKGLEVLRMPLEGRGETLPVFSAGWAARGYLFAEAPGAGWYVKSCTPGELFSLLAGPCARVEWVALDPRPGPRVGDEAANFMPRENFVDYLSCSRAPFRFDRATSIPSGVRRLDGRAIGSGRQEALEDVTMLLDLAISRSRGSSLLDRGTKELAGVTVRTATPARRRPRC